MPRDETDRSRTCQDAGVANRRNRGDGKLRRHRVLCASLAKQYRHRVRCTKSDQHQTQHGDRREKARKRTLRRDNAYRAYAAIYYAPVRADGDRQDLGLQLQSALMDAG